MKYDSFCLSSCLAFRYVACDGVSWRPGLKPRFPNVSVGSMVSVRNNQEIIDALGTMIAEALREPDLGILLSGGMDSAILAALLPAGTRAYTVRFVAEGAVDESRWAIEYADRYKLQHRVIDIHWIDYLNYVDVLMRNKKAPLHAVEVGLYKVALEAKTDGVRRLLIGNGADSTFGGLDRLLSKEWSFEDFMKRYTFVNPDDTLCEPVSVRAVYEPYRRGDSIDVIGFLKVVHGLGVVQAFDNAIQCAGMTSVEPYERLQLGVPLDLARIRSGESKYLLREVFGRLYPGMEMPAKIAFARPMDQWLKDWRGPLRSEFRAGLDLSTFTGDQKWLIWSLNRFVELHDESGS